MEHDGTRASGPPARPAIGANQPGQARPAGARLKAEIWKREKETLVVLSGFIDESSALGPVAADVGSPLHVDLGGVHRINSVGVRGWIEFIRRTSERGPVFLWRCPDVLVQQFGMVTTMLGSAIVCSVLAPYVCESCDHSERPELLIPQDIDFSSGGPAPPARACTRCGEPSTFDDVPDSFFMFLNPRR